MIFQHNNIFLIRLLHNSLSQTDKSLALAIMTANIIQVSRKSQKQICNITNLSEVLINGHYYCTVHVAINETLKRQKMYCCRNKMYNQSNKIIFFAYISLVITNKQHIVISFHICNNKIMIIPTHGNCYSTDE